MVAAFSDQAAIGLGVQAKVVCQADRVRVAIVRVNPAKATDPGGQGKATDLAGRAKATGRGGPAITRGQIVPATGPIIGPIAFRIAIVGTIGETTIAPMSGTTGITTGTTTGTIAITGGTTIGGAVGAGTIRTIPISIIGAWPHGRL